MSVSDGHMINNPEDVYDIYAVTDGEILPIEEMSDEIFAQKMIGDGYAIQPTGNTVYSPVEGTVEQVAKTNHAVYLSLAEGIKLLIHVGIDTIEMKGKGFKANLEKGMKVKVGDPLIQYDAKMIQAEGYNPMIAVVLLNGTENKTELTVFSTEEAKAIETIAMQVRVQEIP